MNEGQDIEATASEQNNPLQQPIAEHNPQEVNLPFHKEQSAANKQSQTTATNSSQNTNDNPLMEVHHPHHLTHKKKWSEYLLEFFMLFFAVFLGFLVENFREHRVEVERTEKHLHSMVENLKYDTVRLQNNLQRNLEIGRGLDSFRQQIRQAIQGKVNANLLYYYSWRYGRGFGNPVKNDAAMAQLKSSGLLRMVKNDALVTEIGDYYDRRWYSVIGARESLTKRQDHLNERYKSFFGYEGFDELLQRDTVFSMSYLPLQYYAEVKNRNPPLTLLNSSPAALELLYTDVAAYEEALRTFDAYIRFCKQGAVSLIDHIKKEYEFEDETNNR